MANELNDTLKSFIDIKVNPQNLQTGTDTAPETRATNLQSVFAQAFPEMDFQIVEDTPGSARIVSKAKEKNNVPAEAPVPQGFSNKLASQGIKDLQAALEAATTDQDKLDIALKLNSLVQTTKAFRFSDYKQRAESEFGVPDLINSIAAVQRAEMASPSNPGNGMPSRERMQLLGSLGVARTHSAQRIKEFADSDVELAAAENLAASTITGLKLSMQLEGKGQVTHEKKAREAEKEAAMASIPPEYIQNISILRYNNSAPADDLRRQIAGQLVENKLRLTETEKVLASADTDALKSLYSTLPKGKEQELALRVMQAKEEALVGPDQAKRNVDLFKAVFEKDISKLPDNPDLSKRYRQKLSEMTAATVGMGSKERDDNLRQVKLAFQREYLAGVVERSFYTDVGNWQGLMQADETARAILLANRGKKDAVTGKPDTLTLDKFIAEYMQYNDGNDLEKKSVALQAIIASAAESLPRSSVLPMPNPDSVILDGQRRIARHQINRAYQQYYENPYQPMLAP